MLQVAVAGINGRMGQSIVRAIEASDEMEVSFGTEGKNVQADSPYPVKTVQAINAQDAFDVLIDFSSPQSTILHLEACLLAGKPIVVGTTGLEEAFVNQIHEAAKNIPIVYAPNMSIGVNMVYAILELAAKQLGEEWQVGISEIHHQHKKDAPSGTALEMGRVVEVASLPARECQYQSLRLGNNPGEHQVTFATDDERVEITHKAQDRMIFARGALKAAQWLVQQPPGCYTMKNVLQNTLST